MVECCGCFYLVLLLWGLGGGAGSFCVEVLGDFFHLVGRFGFGSLVGFVGFSFVCFKQNT